MFDVDKHSGRAGAGLIGRIARALVLPLMPFALWTTDVTARDIAARQLGSGKETVDLQGNEIEVFMYRPPGCAQPSLLFLFHGNGRTATSYRDSARDLADRACFIIFAPLFDRDRFPNWSYHRGGLVQGSDIVPQNEWTVNLVEELVDWARRREQRPDVPYFLFGHSAGGQFLSRVAAFALPKDVQRIIIANPSTYVLPSLEEAAPYGFGGLPKEVESTAMLRSYLAAPITIYLGLQDTGDEDLTTNEPAMRQGENRLERGKVAFEMGRSLADANGWEFGWRIVYARDVGHTVRGMLHAGEVFKALGFSVPGLAP